MSNPETGKALIDVKMEENSNEDLLINDEDYDAETLEIFNEMRKKTYQFPREFFTYKFLSTYLKFKVGDLPISNLTILENHYYKDMRIASYEFTFPFCSPNSRNTWEYTYDMPVMK